jgi:AraC-like DNA-binding protein
MICVATPAAGLQQSVRRYVHIDARSPTATVLQPVPARTAPAMEFTFGDPYEVWSGDKSRHETAHPVAIIGSQTYRRVHLAMHGHIENFVIVFWPGGLSRLFSMPAAVVTNQHVEGRAVLGCSVDELRSRLGEAGSFAERIRVADSYFLQSRGAHDSDSEVTAAARELLRHRGNLRMSRIADRAELSVRQFERRFVSEIGVSPKVFARVARFEAALHMKLRSPGVRWTEIAHACGYYDQMHMVHDFQRLSASSPSEINDDLQRSEVFRSQDLVWRPDLPARA